METKQDRIAMHDDCDNLDIYNDDICQDIECYFDPVIGNIWFAYVNGCNVLDLLRDTVVAKLEREYANHLRQAREDDALDTAIDRYESRMLDHVMNRLDWQPKLDALRIRS
jgi:hypothetical protein